MLELLDKEQYISNLLRKQERQTEIYGELGLNNFIHWQNNNEQVTPKMLVYGKSSQYRQLQLLNKCFDFWESRNAILGSFEQQFVKYRYKRRHTFRTAAQKVCRRDFVSKHSKCLHRYSKNYYNGIRATLYLSSLNISRRKQDEVRKIVSLVSILREYTKCSNTILFKCINIRHIFCFTCVI